MNIDYLLLFQIVFFAIIIFTLYRFTINSVNIKSHDFVLILCNLYLNKLLNFKQKISKEDIYAFEKYKIWRYKEKTKSIFIFKPIIT
ncbi:hypothetical protein EDC19_0598 [Natranaerovirga hydrolytica]|uniref:Uncharacterized protein n=1 Tax=Natranaerovirga hydrolytica TaxID=680378 RepID=A0A4R1MZY1_9FIRM|nr:hypothetical protein EDC19_0598 [Natranaerovirga hydrolytica]